MKCPFFHYDGRVRLCFADEMRPRPAFIWCEHGNERCSIRYRAARRRVREWRSIMFFVNWTSGRRAMSDDGMGGRWMGYFKVELWSYQRFLGCGSIVEDN